MEPELKDKKNKNTEYVVGLDLSKNYAQISVGTTDSDKVDTLTTSLNGDNYLIPMALFKRSEVNQWFAGREAVKYRESEGFFVENLLEHARKGGEVKVGEDSFKPSALLALFMKRALSLVNMVTPLTNVSCFMITVDSLDRQLVGQLSEAVKSLGLKTKEVYFQSHMESFYNYMLFQPVELWNRDVLLYDATGDCMISLRMECNKNTTPIVAFIDSSENRELNDRVYDTADAGGLFARFVEGTVEGHMYSSAYLVGDAFKNEWCKEGVNILCRKGRVFQGNNLFSKGAAYAAKNRLAPTAISTGHAFLGNDKLKSNIGINVLNRGGKDYLALLDGGINWYDASRECEIYLNQGNKVSFLITPLTGKNPETVDITLGDLPKRPPRTTRLKISVTMQSENRLNVKIKDLGFGELYPSANIEWNEVISV